jgi:hypothetical protein
MKWFLIFPITKVPACPPKKGKKKKKRGRHKAPKCGSQLQKVAKKKRDVYNVQL